MFRLLFAISPSLGWSVGAWVAQARQQVPEAGAGGTGIDWLDLLNRFGPWALFVMLVMVGKFVPGFLHERVWEDNQKKDAEIRRLSDATLDKVLPAVTESNRIMKDAVDVMARVTEALRDLNRHPPRDGF